jgi:hypothetical protein
MTCIKFLTVISITIASLIIDISLGNISDITSVSTNWGFGAFIAIAIMYAIGQYLILNFVNQKTKRIRSRSPCFNKVGNVITTIQYGLTAIIAFTTIEILVNYYYHSILLILGSSISYTLATIVMAILVLGFLSWYRSNRDFALLPYGISFMITCISIVASIIFFSITLVDLPDKITNLSNQPIPENEVGHSEGLAERGSWSWTRY